MLVPHNTRRKLGHHCAYRWPSTQLCYAISRHNNYHKISNISCTKSPNLIVSRLVLQLSLPNPMKPLCNIGYPSEIHLKLKFHEISFAHNSCFSSPIALKFCTEHDSVTAVLCAKFQTDWTIETDVMDERDFVRFEFKMSFGRISYIAQHPRY